MTTIGNEDCLRWKRSLPWKRTSSYLRKYIKMRATARARQRWPTETKQCTTEQTSASPRSPIGRGHCVITQLSQRLLALKRARFRRRRIRRIRTITTLAQATCYPRAPINRPIWSQSKKAPKAITDYKILRIWMTISMLDKNFKPANSGTSII